MLLRLLPARLPLAECARLPPAEPAPDPVLIPRPRRMASDTGRYAWSISSSLLPSCMRPPLPFCPEPFLEPEPGRRMAALAGMPPAPIAASLRIRLLCSTL
jgi:hypothetical protein